jgi:hypothetical protein
MTAHEIRNIIIPLNKNSFGYDGISAKLLKTVVDFVSIPSGIFVVGVNSASKNEYQVNPGGKSCRCVSLTIHHRTVPLSRNLGAFTS